MKRINWGKSVYKKWVGDGGGPDGTPPVSLIGGPRAS